MSEFVVMKNVKKTYKMGEVMIHAVDGVDIEIHKGEFAVIVGPSGAGKTTVLNMLGRYGPRDIRQGHCGRTGYQPL